MKLHNAVIEQISKKKTQKENGEITGIPFVFSRLRQDIPEISKGDYFLLLSESGQGKSKISRNMFVYHPLEFSELNGYDVQILYFALEEIGFLQPEGCTNDKNPFVGIKSKYLIINLFHNKSPPPRFPVEICNA